MSAPLPPAAHPYGELDAAFQKAPPPPRCCLRHDAHALCNLFVFQPRRGQQHDPGSLHHAGRLGASPRQPLQSGSLFRVQQDRRRRTHDFALPSMDEHHA